MGNVGKLKRKLSKAKNLKEELDQRGNKLIKKLEIAYSNLLEYKEWQGAKFMVNWAIERDDPLVSLAIQKVNCWVATGLKLEATYLALTLEKQLSFLVDNTSYVEKFFASLPSLEELQKSKNSQKIEQECKELNNQEINELLSSYLQNVQKVAVEGVYEEDRFSYFSKQNKK